MNPQPANAHTLWEQALGFTSNEARHACLQGAFGGDALRFCVLARIASPKLPATFKPAGDQTNWKTKA